ncbi:uncharacterized protein LOC134530552 [Bacillus rossius redtenbacheri]|uniref:uncharacterized protein LOC134530552 n=1 Tax=Bacillus rossius redtenbacheri TaxID=93214 RepID=UPI002FDDCB48
MFSQPINAPSGVGQPGTASCPNTSLDSNTASGPHISNSREKPEWQQRCENFTDSFVMEIDNKFNVYHALLEDRERGDGKKPGSTVKLIGGEVGNAVGTVLGSFFVIPGGRVVGEFVGDKVGDLSHGIKRKKLSKLIYYYHENNKVQKTVLIKGCLQVFRSFESQIFSLNGKMAWQVYVHKFGQDAAHRVINFCANEDVDRFTEDVITKGVVLGKSKKRNPYIPMKRGLIMEFQESKVTSEDIFTKAGVVNFENKKYYRKKNEKSNENMYGYRLLFDWETDNSKALSPEFFNNYESDPRPLKNEYKHIFDAENCSKILDELIAVICCRNVYMPEETFKQVLKDLQDEMVEEIRNNNTHTLQDEEKLEDVMKRIKELDLDTYVKDRHQLLQTMEQEFKQTRTLIVEGFESMRTGRKSEFVTFNFKEHVKPFTGRKAVLGRIQESLHAEGGDRRVVICGLGGMGKSELARRYATKHSKEYDHIMWIDAGSSSSLQRSFARLAEKLGVKTEIKKLGEPTERIITDIVSDIYDELRGRKCLFVFDDAQKCRNHDTTDEGLRDILPSGTIDEFHVIITSCMISWDASIPRISLMVFEETETLELLKELLGKKYQEQDALDIGKLLGHYPLALKIVSSYINDQDITICKFIAEYKQKKIDILKLKFPDSSMDNNKNTILTTFQLTLDKISQQGDTEAVALLKILAYLNPDIISQHLFSKFAEEIKVRYAIQTLKRYSLISQKPDEPLLMMHKLVQEVLRETFKETEECVLEKTLDLFRELKHEETLEYEIVQQFEYIWHYAGLYRKLITRYHNLLQYPLHQAAQLSQLEMVRCLIEKCDFDVYQRDRTGMTALYRANQQNDNLEVIKYLIEKHVQDFKTINKEDWKTLEIAAEQNKTKVLKFLIDESCAEPYLEKNLLLHQAAQNGRLDVVEHLIDNGADVLCKRNGVSVLHEAVLSDVSAIVSFVILHIKRACKNKPEAVQDFISAQDRDGDTPFMWAVKGGKINSINVLKRLGNSGTSVKNKEGNTSLDQANKAANEPLW